jgi:hypothetical protein
LEKSKEKIVIIARLQHGTIKTFQNNNRATLVEQQKEKGHTK